MNNEVLYKKVERILMAKLPPAKDTDELIWNTIVITKEILENE